MPTHLRTREEFPTAKRAKAAYYGIRIGVGGGLSKARIPGAKTSIGVVRGHRSRQLRLLLIKDRSSPPGNRRIIDQRSSDITVSLP